MPSELLACCKKHIKRYVALNPSYPRAGAALCCKECQHRLYYNGKTRTWASWSRECITQ